MFDFRRAIENSPHEDIQSRFERTLLCLNRVGPWQPWRHCLGPHARQFEMTWSARSCGMLGAMSACDAAFRMIGNTLSSWRSFANHTFPLLHGRMRGPTQISLCDCCGCTRPSICDISCPKTKWLNLCLQLRLSEICVHTFLLPGQQTTRAAVAPSPSNCMALLCYGSQSSNAAAPASARQATSCDTCIPDK